MNTVKPTPAPDDNTPGTPAQAGESAEPTVVLSAPDDSGGTEPAAVLPPAETTEPTTVLSAAPGSEPTADLSSTPPASAGDASSLASPAASGPVTASASPADSSPVAPTGPDSAAVDEPTVVLPPADEPTVALRMEEAAVAPPPAEADEATVTLDAGEVTAQTAATAPTGGDEVTAVTSPAEVDEPPITLLPAEVDEGTAVVSPAEVDEGTAVVPAVEVDEATVALSAAEVADATVAISAGEVAAAVAAAAEKSEPATVITAAAEPTTVITAGSEPTIALPKPRSAPDAESTIALLETRSAPDADSTIALPETRSAPDADSTIALLETRSAPDADSTIALPRPRSAPEAESAGGMSERWFAPASESTVALPSVPAQRSAPTVTPPPAEPAIALPSAPSAPAAVPPPVKSVSRRRLLWAIPAIAGTAVLGGTIAALAGRDTPKATKAPNLVVSEPAPAQVPAPAPTTPRPTAPIMKVPVHTLADFRKVVPGEAFPTDAIALTIDDGPHPVWTPQILRLLEKYHVPALFCMIGNQVLGHEPTARDVVADGHHIANHTWSHPLNVAELSARKALKEIDRAQDKIYSTTGYAPALFRAPGGAWSKGLSESVSKSSVIPMDWTTDPRDWSRPGVAHITKRLLAAKPGQILLCHDGGGDRSQTVASLKTVIPALQAKGLKFVALT